MKLYNTASKKVENIPNPGQNIKFYSCGPTVYDRPTIGNWASFIRYDVLARALNTTGYELDWVMNITDVGHLVSDADEGEDKLEKGARRESKTAWEIAEIYSDYFIKGLDFFNISIERNKIVKATDHIDAQIELIKTLEAGNHTYKTEDGVYFDSTTFSDYGKMARLDLAGLKEGARVATISGKKHPTDFALWKFSSLGVKRDMEWKSPWGTGFPGWHLECSAIILSELGETINIHAGGIEHIPVHHTNEIAQSESATGKKLAEVWVHNNHLKINGEKISKSLNNGYTIEDIKKRGFNGLDFRMFVLRSNYRSESNFTWDILKEARQQRLELQASADLRFQMPGNSSEDISILKKTIQTAVEDNLNTPLIVSFLTELNQKLAKGLVYEKKEFINFLEWLDELLGLELLNSENISERQTKMINEREEARNRKDWKGSDRIRDELKTQNIGVKDTDNGPIWFREI